MGDIYSSKQPLSWETDKESIKGCVTAGLYMPWGEINRIGPERGKGKKETGKQWPQFFCWGQICIERHTSDESEFPLKLPSCHQSRTHTYLQRQMLQLVTPLTAPGSCDPYDTVKGASRINLQPWGTPHTHTHQSFPRHLQHSEGTLYKSQAVFRVVLLAMVPIAWLGWWHLRASEVLHWLFYLLLLTYTSSHSISQACEAPFPQLC